MLVLSDVRTNVQTIETTTTDAVIHKRTKGEEEEEVQRLKRTRTRTRTITTTITVLIPKPQEDFIIVFFICQHKLYNEDDNRFRFRYRHRHKYRYRYRQIQKISITIAATVGYITDIFYYLVPTPPAEVF